MANDRLFEMLAAAKSQPSHTLRAVESAGQAGQDIIGGYMGGKEIGQKLDQYRLLSTPLGSMYPDPSQIPFGLGPNHTVKDLLTLAPAYENFVPSSLISGAAKSFGANVNDGSASPPPQTDNPAPMGGTSNPAPPPGSTQLAAIQGTGAGAQDNVPAGTPPAVIGNSGASSSPSINVPSGGMGLKGFQNVVLPALKAGQEQRNYNTTQANEDRRQQTGIAAENARQANTIQAEKNRTMAGETAKIAPSLTEAGTIQDDINALRPLYQNYKPIPFMGSALANLTAKSGSSSFGTPTMQAGKQIDQITPSLTAKVNRLLNGRFNQEEANMLGAKVIPNSNDDTGNFNQKTGNLQRLVAVMKSGDINALNMVASSIAGQPVNASLPSSLNGTSNPSQMPPNSNRTPINQFPTEADVPPNLPKGTIIYVNGRRAVIR